MIKSTIFILCTCSLITVAYSHNDFFHLVNDSAAKLDYVRTKVDIDYNFLLSLDVVVSKKTKKNNYVGIGLGLGLNRTYAINNYAFNEINGFLEWIKWEMNYAYIPNKYVGLEMGIRGAIVGYIIDFYENLEMRNEMVMGLFCRPMFGTKNIKIGTSVYANLIKNDKKIFHFDNIVLSPLIPIYFYPIVIRLSL